MASFVTPHASYHGVIHVDEEEEQSSIEISSDDSSNDIIEVPDSTSEVEPENLEDTDEAEIVEEEDGFMMTSGKSITNMCSVPGVTKQQLEPSGSPDTYNVLDYFQSDNMTLRKGKTVELNDGDFFKIDLIVQAVTTEVFLRGRRFRRTTRLGGLISGRPNEVCWIKESFQDGSGTEEEVPLANLVRMRQLRLTNKAYKDLSVRNTMEWPPTNKLYKKEGILFCRTKYEVAYTSLAQKSKNNSFSFVDKCIRGLYSDEVDGEYWEDPADIRAARRGLHNPMERLRRSVSTTTLVDDGGGRTAQGTATQETPDQYTFGDCFCGGGGMSCGAKLAGLAVKWGLDFDREAIRTYQLNFEGASCENTSVDHFLNADIFPPEQYHVDVLHMSPPCQSFSPAQAVKPEDYEDKQAVILAVNDLVKMVKPRIITMEETFGLLHPVNREFFISVVNSLVDQGYSVRWKVMNFGEYGVPQNRRRLVLIASGYVVSLSLALSTSLKQ